MLLVAKTMVWSIKHIVLSLVRSVARTYQMIPYKRRSVFLLMALLCLSVLYVSKMGALVDTFLEFVDTQRRATLYYADQNKPQFIKWQSGNNYRILLLWTPWFGMKGWYVGLGANGLHHRKCPELRCTITFDRDKLLSADIVLFHVRDITDGAQSMPPVHPVRQRWVFVTQESPENTYIHAAWWLNRNIDLAVYDDMFNTTMTYMHYSDIPVPYGMYRKRAKRTVPFHFDLTNRTNVALWYASNCKATEGAVNRLSFVTDLQKHMSVSVFGACGSPDPCRRDNPCAIKLKHTYKFYLAFENSRCREYITEKFWNNLAHGMVPIVMGAEMEDYELLAPPNSFIHVDNFTSTKALGDYINYLDKHDEAYLEYHKWRQDYETTNTQFDPHQDNWCKLCELAHQGPTENKSYNVSDFWSVNKLCKSS